ncbi:MAG: hypothetical protein U0401_33805 [Anaerolineae bacterium]
MGKSKILFLMAIIVVPLFLLALAIAGVFVGYGLTSAATTAQEPKVDRAKVEDTILNIAADYVGTKDLDSARDRLAALGLPNTDQYVSFMVDRYIQEERGANDVDTQNLFVLAEALGATTPSQVAALATSTPTLAPTATPTATPVPTDTPTATSTPTQLPPTDTPAPVAPTDTPVPPTNTPGPPTNTPEPTATPVPTSPPVDYVIAEAYLIPNPSYGGCPGAHSIFVTVVDVNGNPMDGVFVEDTGHAVPPKVSGEKGPGKVEYDLWKNGFSLYVSKHSDGSPATSDITPKLSSVDEDIPNEWLIQANYCKDMNDCLQRKSSNQLCRGHYAYNVTFKRTH